MYDPISQKDFYQMKALFDPLVVKKLTLATPAEIFANGDSAEAAQIKRAAAEKPIKARMEAIEGAIRKRLEEERVLMLPPAAQAPSENRKATQSGRTNAVDDYSRPSSVTRSKSETLIPEARKEFEALEKQPLTRPRRGGGGQRGGGGLPAF
jgi:hypothetical protein